MNGTAKRWGWMAAIALATIAVIATTASPAAAKVMPPSSVAYGHTYGEWSALWWSWIWSTPAVIDEDGNVTNPNLDTTGAYTLAGQENNHVIFLAGAFWGSVERTITIPAGHPLFFPVANAFSDDVDYPVDITIAELQEMNKNIVDGFPLGDLYATLNGVPLVTSEQLPAFRVQSPPFTYVLPEDGLWAFFGSSWPAGLVDKAVSDGYWIMLSPLPPGEYDLAFGVNLGWGVYVAYHITVVDDD